MKKRTISAYNDLKTSFLCKLFIFIGILLLIFYIFEQVVSFFGIADTVLGSILAFSILFLGIGFLLGFLSCQFCKLAKIAEEIESGHEIETDQSDKKSVKK